MLLGEANFSFTLALATLLAAAGGQETERHAQSETNQMRSEAAGYLGVDASVERRVRLTATGFSCASLLQGKSKCPLIKNITYV